jgi:hypothetical protein
MAPYGSAIKAWPRGQIMAATPRRPWGPQASEKLRHDDAAISMSDPALELGSENDAVCDGYRAF